MTYQQFLTMQYARRQIVIMEKVIITDSECTENHLLLQIKIVEGKNKGKKLCWEINTDNQYKMYNAISVIWCSIYKVKGDKFNQVLRDTNQFHGVPFYLGYITDKNGNIEMKYCNEIKQPKQKIFKKLLKFIKTNFGRN